MVYRRRADGAVVDRGRVAGVAIGEAMINDPRLIDPRYVLHTLSYSSAWAVLLAMLMDDCPNPCGVHWLCRRAGKSAPTVRGALSLLIEAGAVREARPDYYQLTDGVRQLPLPFRQLGQPTVLNGELAPTSNQPSSLGELDSGQTSLTMRPVTTHHQPSFSGNGELDSHHQPSVNGELAPTSNQPFDVNEKTFSREKNFFSDHDDDDDLRSFPDQELNHHHHSSNSARGGKIFSPVAFLESIGMNGPHPLVMTDAPLPVLVAWWWSARSNPRIHTPQGFMRSRLTSVPPVPPPTPYLDLAETWLEMGIEDREYLVFVATGNDRGSIRHMPPTSGEEMLVLLSDEFYPELDAAALDAFLTIWRVCPQELSTGCGQMET